MTDSVLLLDLGGSAVKASLGEVTAAVDVTVDRPAPGRAELDPDRTWAAAVSAVRECLAGPPGRARSVEAIVVCSFRQGFTLLDRAGQPLLPLISNSDQRGADHLAACAPLYGLTGHWPAAELTLPKVLHLLATAPELATRASRLSFVHDWLVGKLCGAQITELSYACAGGMADVGARRWASDALAELGVPLSWLAEPVEAGTCVGQLSAGVADTCGLRPGISVHAGCGDTQMAALGVGGVAEGTITVVAGSSTPVQLASSAPLSDPREHPWVSTHARPGWWAAETNAGYPGSFQAWGIRVLRAFGEDGDTSSDGLLALTGTPQWSKEAWSGRPAAALVGLRPDHSPAQIRTALAEAHAFAVRGNIEDLERTAGLSRRVVVTGGAAPSLAPVLAGVLGREVEEQASGAAGAIALVTGQDPPPDGRRHPPGPGDSAPGSSRQRGTDPDTAYRRWRTAYAAACTPGSVG